MSKVCRYKDDPLSGATYKACIRTDPFSGKEICMKGDTYIYSGGLFLTGNIIKVSLMQLQEHGHIKKH